MGRIVGGFGTAHILMKRGSAGAPGERVFAGMREIGRRVRALRPDRVVIVSSDHFYNYRIGTDVAFAVAAADVHVPFGDMHLPVEPLPGDTAFADGLARHAAAAGFPLHRLDDYRPDHGVVIPALTIGRAGGVPIIPIITSTAHDPAPSLADGWRLGGLLAEFVAVACPGQRVAVVGTGGLSHWLGVAEMGRVNPDFDHRVLDALTAGEAETLLDWATEDIRRDGGNGGLEIVNWLIMAGSLRGVRGERVYYEAIPEWITGMGGIELFAAPEGHP